MEVHGRDVATECYRVTHPVGDRLVSALVPERLAADMTFAAVRPSHEDAYRWMASQRHKIEAAIESLARGGKAKAPFDQITIVEED